MTSVYPGTELELFATAKNWKTYVAESLRPYIRGRVLDVGAGIGGNIHYLTNPAVTAWTALEPDSRLASAIGEAEGRTVVVGTLAALPPEMKYDTILYMDVLEHIDDDRAELRSAARLLAPGGNLVVLAPAHQFLFSPFDTAVGHHRRYNLPQLRALTPLGLRTELCRLMDSVGFFASLANRILLRQTDPTPGQIAVWDRLMVRASRLIDPVIRFHIGKSALMVWRAPEPAACRA